MIDEDNCARNQEIRKQQEQFSTEELIRIALTETEQELAWNPVVVLHGRDTPEVLETARMLCAGKAAEERALGANILGQLGYSKHTFPEECFQTLAAMLPGETDAEVLNSVTVAFGHLRDSCAVPLIVPLKDHPDADVRRGVVHGLYTQTDPPRG